MKKIVVSGSFDDLRSQTVRFLEEATKAGEVHVLLWSDALVQAVHGKAPRFPLAERQYVLESLRFVSRVLPIEAIGGIDSLPQTDGFHPDAWVVEEASHSPARQQVCAERGLEYRVIPDRQLVGFPVRRNDALVVPSGRRKVLVTGCYDWLHSGHVRFFEQVSRLGDLYVVVGSDRNVRLLKGQGHPLFGQEERRYMVQAVRFVHAALISSGAGWMDAEPEIALLQPDIYAVNEDGDKPEKRAFCEEHGLEYVVLERVPKEGLPRRESRHLRGF